ncbi:MAG: response regulator [Pyrinomonadaceae bacterium]
MTQSAATLATILLVEDSDDSRQMLRLTLESWGYRVTEAHDGREATEAARERCPDLILMDLNMPRMDGLAAAKFIRDCGEPCRDVPIVAITAFDVYGMREAALEAGCNDYIAKPINYKVLDATVRRLTSPW